MNSLTAPYLSTLAITMPLLRQVEALSYYRGQQDLYRSQAPELLKQLQTLATIESTESSTRLEGVSAPRQRIEQLILKDPTPHSRSESEIAGYRDALRMIHENAQHMPFSENIIKQLHQMLYAYLPQTGGHYKSTQNDIVEKDTTGTVIKVRFRPLSPVQTPGAMMDLVERYRTLDADGELAPLLLVALTILDFLCIHPFNDGNGRTARLLTLLLLYQQGYEVGRYISLERVIEESREGYYDTLEISSQGWHDGSHNVTPWLDYFLGMLTKAYKEYEARVTTIRGSHGTKSDMVRFAVARRLQPFKISDIERELPEVSREQIRVVLNQLRTEGVLRLEGSGRGSSYVPLNPTSLS
ncbi:MAG: Fic family protein [Deinococcota bacterium]